MLDQSGQMEVLRREIGTVFNVKTTHTPTHTHAVSKAAGSSRRMITRGTDGMLLLPLAYSLTVVSVGKAAVS